MLLLLCLIRRSFFLLLHLLQQGYFTRVEDDLLFQTSSGCPKLVYLRSKGLILPNKLCFALRLCLLGGFSVRMFRHFNFGLKVSAYDDPICAIRLNGNKIILVAQVSVGIAIYRFSSTAIHEDVITFLDMLSSTKSPLVIRGIALASNTSKHSSATFQ